MRKIYALVLAIIMLLILVFSLYRTSWSTRTGTQRLAKTVSQGAAAESRSPPAPVFAQSTANAVDKEKKQLSTSAKDAWDMLFLTPISFYGKVVDEKGQPVSEADVAISFADTPGPGELDTKRKIKSGSDGMFHIRGHGLAIVVMVSKSGYYHQDQSDGDFTYSISAGQTDTHTDSTNPAIFKLRKMGKVAALVHVEKYFHIKKDGTPIEIDLATGEKSVSGIGNLKVETWTFDQGHNPSSSQPYDWHCRISVLGGGMVAYTDEFSFEAPESGYLPSDEIKMPASEGKRWNDQATRQYFVKLPGNRYARLEFVMTAANNHYFKVSSYLNTVPGDRNLESGPESLGGQ